MFTEETNGIGSLISEEISFEGVLVHDGICGVGKTTRAIDLINAFPKFIDGHRQKFIFCTPYIMECHRIADTIPIDIPKEHKDSFEEEATNNFEQDCNKEPRRNELGHEIYRTDRKIHGRNFHHPKKIRDRKSLGFKQLLRSGNDIVITHGLFKFWDKEIIKLISDDNNYHLIIDESPPLLGSPADFNENGTTPEDLNILLKNKEIHIDSESDVISWVDDSSITASLSLYKPFYNLCKQEKIIAFAHDQDRLTFRPIGRVHPDQFSCFKSVRLLTYLFSGSICESYFKLYHIPYQVRDLTNEALRSDSIRNYASLIKIHWPSNINNVIKNLNQSALNSTWFDKALRSADFESDLDALIDSTSSFFKNSKIEADKKVWTTFNKAKTRLSMGRGYGSDQFISCIQRATNSYKHKEVLAYLLNLHPNTNIKNYLHSKGVPMNANSFALESMIQWIFRSRIRDGKPISVFIPSRRMRVLLMGWIRTMNESHERLTSNYYSQIETYAEKGSLAFDLSELMSQIGSEEE